MKRVLLALCLCIIPIGCKPATSNTPPAALVPGALNSFDQTSYQTLMAVQATLNSLNASYKSNPTGLASIKSALDQATSDYNIAELTWQTYHAAATPENEQAVTTAIAKVNSDVSSIKVAK